jgi:peptidoglycan/LPS O-acetylase OafA/YrhL
LEFIAGCLIAHFHTRHRMGAGACLVLLAAGGAWWVTGYAWHVEAGLGLEPGNVWRVVIFGIPAAAFTWGLPSLELTGVIRPWRFVVWLGDASYSIYLSHLLVLSVAGRLAWAFVVPGVAWNITAMVAMTGLVLLVGALSYRLIEFPIIRSAKRWQYRALTKLQPKRV